MAVLKHSARLIAMGQLAFQERFSTFLLYSFLSDHGVYHRSDAGTPGVKWNAPEPPVTVGLDEDIVLVGIWKRFGAGEIGVDRQVLEERIPLLGIQAPGQEC